MDRRRVALALGLLLQIGCGDDFAGASATGDPAGLPGSGAAWVIYFTSDQHGKATRELFFVDCSGLAPGPTVRVNEPLAAGAAIDYTPVVSRKRRWLSYTVDDRTFGRSLWFVRLDGPTLGAPARAMLPGQADFGTPIFSADERQVAFLASKDGAHEALHLCALTATAAVCRRVGARRRRPAASPVRYSRRTAVRWPTPPTSKATGPPSCSWPAPR